jgi:DNA-binding SARP family transcriptional activator/Tfp pilus assembly protein PilF
VLVEFEIRVLGPVELRSDGRRDMYGSAKEVQLLAALALDAGRAVPLDTLIGRLWDESPPRKPRASLHVFAARIRRRIGHDRLSQQAGSYVLDIDPDAVDCHRFERLAAQARSLASSGDDIQALALLRQAEALWRGTPLTGFTGLWAERVRRRLAEQRLAATLSRSEIELRLGHFADLVGELSALVEQYPADEAVTGHFMTAAFGAGRQTDALRAYEALRRRLRDEGTEPGEALTRTYRRILDRAPVAELIPGSLPAVLPPAPQNLPACAETIVGRGEQLRALEAPASGVIAFQAITGMGGIGKTLLALHTARRLARHYPDAALYLNLRAHSGQRPLTPQAALATLLRHLGIPAAAIPQELDDLTTLWRTVLSTRRAIIVLDDAAGPEQLQPLLPGDSPSLVLITSRRRLTGMPGIRHIFLDLLPAKDAEALLTDLVGAERAADPAAVAELARLCGYLPLALELAAGRLQSRPAWTVSHLVQRMSNDPDRLAEIRDGSFEITSLFSDSYDTLSAEQQRAFRLLSLHFTPTFGPHASAALIGLPLEATERMLETLLDAHLLRELEQERYEFHDLIGVFARSLAAREPEPLRRAALDRLAAFYLHAVAAGDLRLHPRRPRADLPLPPAPFALPLWPDPQQTKTWLLAETPAFTAAARHFRDHGSPRLAAQLAHAAAGFLDAEGFSAEGEELLSQAVDFWTTAGERGPEAHALIALAAVQSQTGRYEQAEASGRQALAAARAVGDAVAEAESLRALGLLYWNVGRLGESRSRLQEALDSGVERGEPWYVARYQNNLGIVLLQLGEHARAMELFREALAGFVRTQDPRGEGQALNNLGDTHLHIGERDKAYRAYSRSLDIISRVGSRSEKALGQLNLVASRPATQDPAEALEAARQGLATFRLVDDKGNEVTALNVIATVLLESGQDVEAAAHYAAALALARRIGATLEEIPALRGLGLAELRTGRYAAASEKLAFALALARNMKATEEEAFTHTSLSELFSTTGQNDAAAMHLRASYDILAKIDKPAAARIREQLERLPRVDPLG